MDLRKVLDQLRQELANLDAAILSLESLQQESRRRGRPPKVLSHPHKTHSPRKSAPANDPEPDGH